jgi:hypothetical protein
LTCFGNPNDQSLAFGAQHLALKKEQVAFLGGPALPQRAQLFIVP